MTSVTNAIGATGTAIANASSGILNAVAQLSPTQLAGVSSWFSALAGGETQQEKSALALLNMYVEALRNNNLVQASTIEASVTAIGAQGLPMWFIDTLPSVWVATTWQDAAKAVQAIQVKLDGTN